MINLAFYFEITDADAERTLTALQSDPKSQVEVRINSPGGSVTAGLAIFNALRARATTVFIDGVAASIASLIAMAGQKIIAAENALVMIHNPWASTTGNSANLRKTADTLDTHCDAMLRAYGRTGLPRDRLLAMCAEETWMSADEALALGFVDSIVEPLAFAAHSPTCYSKFRNTPKEILVPDPTTNAPAPTSVPNQPSKSDKTLEAFKAGLASDSVANAAHDAVMAALAARNEEILALGSGLSPSHAAYPLLIAALADPKVTPQAFGQRVLAKMAEGRESLSGYGAAQSASHGAGGDFVAAASDALAIRAGLSVDQPHPGARDVQGMDIAALAQACVDRSGRAGDLRGGGRGALIKAALTTSDFPAILADTLGKALRTGFDTEPSTIDAWTRKVLVPDFKPQTRVTLGSAPMLKFVPEGGEYEHGSVDEDRSVAYAVSKFGRIVQLSWEALVNDDLGAFLRITAGLGQAAARAEADSIYAAFAENSGAGPLMQDGIPLFHATHSNVAASAPSLGATSLNSARVLLRRQTAVGGAPINAVPRYILAAPEHEGEIETLLAAASRSMSQGANNALVPAWLANLTPVIEPRLDVGAFYVLADPAAVDTVERAWLEADNGPVVTERDAFDTDARYYKVRHVFGSRWLDWRGAVKVPLA